MTPLRTSIVRLSLMAAACVGLASAQTRQNYIGVVRQGPELLVEIAAGASGPADRLELRLNKESVRGAKLEFGPDGWKASSDGSTLVLTGPGLRSFPALFRVTIGEPDTPPFVRVRVFAAGEKVVERNLRILVQPPVTVSEGLEGLLAFPAIVFAGESVLGRVLIPQATHDSGAWYVGERKTEASGGAVRLVIPAEDPGEIELAARFDDAWGRTVLRGKKRLRVEPSPRALERPRIDAVQPIALAGEALTVCGSFPPASRTGVLLDGKQPLEVIAGSARSLILSLPDQASPGRHLLSGDADKGFPSGILALDLIKLDTTVDRAMEPPNVRIKVRGTELPVRLRVVNLNPFAARLEGGESQIVETDGGSENVAYIPMRPSELAGVGPRDLNIVFTLAGGREACGGLGPS